MSDIDIHHLAAAYALDALDARERAAFEAHYPSCEVCRADVLEFRSTLAVVAEAEADGATTRSPATGARRDRPDPTALAAPSRRCHRSGRASTPPPADDRDRVGRGRRGRSCSRPVR